MKSSPTPRTSNMRRLRNRHRDHEERASVVADLDRAVPAGHDELHHRKAEAAGPVRVLVFGGESRGEDEVRALGRHPGARVPNPEAQRRSRLYPEVQVDLAL